MPREYRHIKQFEKEILELDIVQTAFINKRFSKEALN